MKKFTAIAAGLGCALVLAVAAGAAPGPKATGDAWSYNPGVWATHMVFNAIPTDLVTPSTAAKGNVEIWEYNLATDTLFQHFMGTVDCYFQQTDNIGYLAGAVTWVDPLSVPAQQIDKAYFRASVIDNGEGADPASPPDQFPPDQIKFNRNATSYSAVHTDFGYCGAINPANINLPVTSGNVQVFPFPAP
jgi:hypothetical protein